MSYLGSWLGSVTSGKSLHLSEQPHCLHLTNERREPAHSRCHLNGALGMSSALAGRTEASLQGQTHLPGSPPGQFTLLSLGPSGQAVGSSRLRSSPSRMDEDLSEFKEKASVSAS